MGEYLYVPAPVLCQGTDEDVLLEMGNVICNGLVDRILKENGLKLRVPGDYLDPTLLEIAANEFQVLLGIIRAWKSIAGERRDEVRPGVGSGSIHDESGNQVVHVGSVISYRASYEEIQQFAAQASVALNKSQSLRNAIWLNGRRDRNAADYYMMYEYAVAEFGGGANISSTLDVPVAEISRFRQSANNLCPTMGGRHAGSEATPHWRLELQREFIAALLRKWIFHLANTS